MQPIVMDKLFTPSYRMPTAYALSRPPLLVQSSSSGLRGSIGWHDAIVVWTQQLKRHKKIKTIVHKERVKCRAGLEDDAPFAVAIAASILSTLVLPLDNGSEEGNNSVSPIGGDDVRFAAMGIISFIPLFNWLVWVFAWLDTKKQRYLVYAIVYLAPYLRSGLSVSPEDSWLPLASVLACILHVQLDISANSEGGEDLNISKAMFTGTKVKQMRERAEILLGRLRILAARPEAPKVGLEGEKSLTGEEIALAEMEQWDEKLAKSKANEKSEKARDVES